MQLRGTLCMSVISCEETYALYKDVDTLMESHDLPRTGSAKWQILSATRVWPPSSNVKIRLLQDGFQTCSMPTTKPTLHYCQETVLITGVLKLFHFMFHKRCLCILWFSRYSRFSEHLPLNVMLLRNMMLYWTGSGRTAVSREPCNVTCMAVSPLVFSAV